MAPLDVVIVNHNAGPHLARCLGSLAAGLAGLDWQALVVDNASTDGSDRAALDLGVRVRLHAAGGNLGFARAVNVGVRLTSAPWLLLLNPDCRLERDVIAPLVGQLEADARCAAAAPCVTDEDGTPQGNARGDPTLFTGVFGRSALLRRLLPRTRAARRNVVLPEHVPPGVASVEVDWVAGSCVLVRREAFDAVGGFDERYFLYWEDADFCRRLRAAGWTIRFLPGARVAHLGAQSARRQPALARREFHRSAYLYYRTHVAPAPWDPRRPLARLLLAARSLALRLASPTSPLKGDPPPPVQDR
jgi:GT2 family glycosyltransferase